MKKYTQQHVQAVADSIHTTLQYANTVDASASEYLSRVVNTVAFNAASIVRFLKTRAFKSTKNYTTAL